MRSGSLKKAREGERMIRWNALRVAGVALVMLTVGGLLAVASAPSGTPQFGGKVQAHVPVYPALGADTSLDLFAGLGSVEFQSRTDLALVPYTLAEQTLRVALVRDWLSLYGEYRFSVLPIGITSVMLLVRAAPPHVVQGDGVRSTDVWIEGEARQKGDARGPFPQRTELWAKGSLVETLPGPFVDALTVGASLSATASDPHGGQIWWTGALLLGAKLGTAALESETSFSVTPVRLELEQVTLTSGTTPWGLSAYGRVSFAGPAFLPVLEFGVALSFGGQSLLDPSQGNCSGGVCTDW